MTPSAAISPASSRETRRRKQPDRRCAAPVAACSQTARTGAAGCAPLGRYVDAGGHPREVLALAGAAGSVLVVDRDVHTLGDGRLVAHLASDEPAHNAELICALYLADPGGRRARAVTAEDLRVAPFSAGARLASSAVTHTAEADRTSGETGCPTLDPHGVPELVDRHGRAYRLAPTTGRPSIPELRWLRLPGCRQADRVCVVSLREVVGELESYEPARRLTVAALARHIDRPGLSTASLGAELRRLDASRIVLNRGLREAVRRAVREDGQSMSEIALRCGRVKYDARGNPSGETSWLARRVGLAPESGRNMPTPWIHSEVLALIARVGLGLSPREVELG